MGEKEYENWPAGLVYAPGSIWHGSRIGLHKESTLLQIQLNRLTDFIAFLFEHHCDHLTEGEAWQEFQEHELRQLTNQVANEN